MATIQNLNNTHVSDELDTQVTQELATLEATFLPLMVNLSPDERRRYGSIGEQNKLMVNKTHDYALKQPALRSPDVDWDEFIKDHAYRQRLEAYIARLQRLIDGLANAKTLHDFDNYQAALDDYAYTGYKTQTAAPGFAVKYREMKQFFTRVVSKPEKDEEQ